LNGISFKEEYKAWERPLLGGEKDGQGELPVSKWCLGQEISVAIREDGQCPLLPLHTKISETAEASNWAALPHASLARPMEHCRYPSRIWHFSN
jgi:hypothetical protein